MEKGGEGIKLKQKPETNLKPLRRANSTCGEKISDTLAKPIILRNTSCGSFNATWLPDILYKTVHRCVEG